MKTVLVLCIGILISTLSCQQGESWMDLFNGTDLQGWEISDGNAEVWVESGMIIACQTDTANFPYLVTKEVYDDFILELDLKITGELNSGVAIRGNSDPDINNGAMNGYQMEIDQSERRWTGGIYETAGRLWLTPLEGMEKEMAAYQKSQWNHYRIEAIGDVFKIWVNDVPTTHLIDSKTASGKIAFQIHKRRPEMEIDTMRIRNIRIITDDPGRFTRPITLDPVTVD